MSLWPVFAALLVLPCLLGGALAITAFRMLRVHGSIPALGIAFSLGFLVAGITLNLEVLALHIVSQL